MILPETRIKLRNWNDELNKATINGMLSPKSQLDFIAKAEQIMDENDAVVEAKIIVGELDETGTRVTSPPPSSGLFRP